MGTCPQCVHFRRVRPASQLLANAIGTTDAAVSTALGKIVEDEQKQREQEAELKVAQARGGHDEWGSQPVMSDFCGLREADGVYLVAERKNSGGRCQDFAPGRPTSHRCVDCVHRVPATGAEEDRGLEATYGNMSAQSISAGVSSTVPDNLLTKHREGTASRKAFELAGAYAARGVLPNKPHYFDTCAKFSTDDEHVICVLRNVHNTCDKWKAASAGQAISAARDHVSMSQSRAVPDRPESSLSARLRAGSHATQRFVPQPAAASRRGEDGNDKVIHRGPPPLTEGMIVQLERFHEWLLDVELGQNHVKAMREVVKREWARKNGAMIAMIQQELEFFGVVQGGEAATRDYWREVNQPSFVATLRSNDDGFSRSVIKLFDAANAPITPGDPPLSRKAANCFLDLLAFMRAVVGGAEPAAVDPKTKERWIRELVAEYPRYASDVRASIASAPALWTEVRAAWPGLSDERRAACRQQWAESLGVDLAAPASLPPVSSEPYQVPRRSIGEGELSTSDVLAAQKRIQEQQISAQLRSNLAKITHETNMAIIRNMT